MKNSLLTLTFTLIFNLSYSQQKTLHPKKVEGLKDNLNKSKEITFQKQEKIINEESLEEYQKSAYSRISNLIKIQFENWLSKSEFEKKEKYQKRIVENSKRSFDSICHKILLDEISLITNDNNLKLEIGEYDAENEKFKIKIKIFKTEINENLEIKLADAQVFKKNSGRIKISEISTHWCFNNNDLIPTLFDFSIYKDKATQRELVATKDISNSLQNKKLLIFTTNQLQIKNENFSNLEYNFDIYNSQLIKQLEDVKNLIDVDAEFPGGKQKFYDFIGKNFTTPSGQEISGKIVFSFTVEKDGSLTDIKILNDLGYGTGIEVERVLKKSPKWIPARKNGQTVPSVLTRSIGISGE